MRICLVLGVQAMKVSCLPWRDGGGGEPLTASMERERFLWGARSCFVFVSCPGAGARDFSVRSLLPDSVPTHLFHKFLLPP